MDVSISKAEWRTLYRTAIKASSLIDDAYTSPRQRNTARVLRKTIKDIARKNKI